MHLLDPAVYALGPCPAGQLTCVLFPGVLLAEEWRPADKRPPPGAESQGPCRGAGNAQTHGSGVAETQEEACGEVVLPSVHLLCPRFSTSMLLL